MDEYCTAPAPAPADRSQQATSPGGAQPVEHSSEAPQRGASSLAVLLIVTFLAFLNYASLLPVVPMWASSGGAASMVVGATTGVMMGATVLTQLAAPVLFRLFRLRLMLIVGAILLGVPTPLYILSEEVTWVLSITAVRGMGFALVVISGATLVAELFQKGRLASAASLYGTAAALPNLAALAGGVWLADTWGFSVVFWVAGAACLLAAIVSIRLPARARGTFNLPSLSSVRHIGAPMVPLVLTASAFGAATTFLPVSGPAVSAVTWALLTASTALVLGRLGAGFVGDRIGAGRMLIASLILAAVGLALISQALGDSPALLLTGAALLGAGFGICQNDSFVTTVQRLGPARTATASTLWNMAYDGGLGLGAVALGWIIGSAGYAGAFLVMALGIAILGLITRHIALRAQPGSA